MMVVANGSPFGTFAPGPVTSLVLAAAGAPSDSWAGKRLAFLFRSLGVALLRGQPLDVSRFGARMRLYPVNNITEKQLLFTPQYFDPDERSFLHTRFRPGFRFVDIGANCGGYCLFVAASAGADAKILALEPQPRIFQRLRANLRQNAFSTMTALECAASDRDGPISFFLNTTNNGESSVLPSRAKGSDGELIVSGRALAGLLVEQGFERVDAMKIDIEGAEHMVLSAFFRDANPALWPSVLIAERAGTSVEEQPPLSALLGNNGYEPRRETRTNTIYERR